ncbi:hypothetical protein [Pararobbsia alpina]|uniref:Flagellar assembly protein FliH/Type III secretion system HrpE domain-containing protein n=1 Tax=Pararobbsia alpina TaxID=621374 RepID=A0A6S7BTN3_9BURK|nr:hypothetical protein [Pararobbsia alpina]CAB3798857.1 hypothetical protein LMG28138_04541 [Pararobbsia alpina]
MLRRIRTELPLPVVEGVLVERASVRNAAVGVKLIDAARKRARQIVDTANSEAEAVRRLACAEGFREGFGESLGMLGEWLHQHDAICTEAVLRLRDEVQARLSSALLNPLVVAHVVEAVFASTSAWQAQRIRVRLPALVASQATHLAQAVAQAGGAALEIMPSHDSRLTIECGKHVFVYDADELAQSIVRRDCGQDTGIDFSILRTQARDPSR